MTAVSARRIVELLVDLVFEEHFRLCDGRPWECCHGNNGELAVARLVEAGMYIGKRRAHLDIPDEPENAKLLAENLDYWSQATTWPNGPPHVGRHARVFQRVAEAARNWARRSPLERLAEAALELD